MRLTFPFEETTFQGPLMPSQNTFPKRILVLIPILLLGTLTGCETNQVEQPAEVTFVSTSDLLSTIVEREMSASVTDESIASDPRSFRIAVLEKTVGEGLEAVEKLLSSTDVTEEQLAQARQTKSRLLYLGAKHGDSNHETALSELAEQWLNERPAAVECQWAVYHWLRYHYVDQQQPVDETVATVSDFSAMFANTESAMLLLTSAAIQLGDRDEVEAAEKLLSLAHQADSGAATLQAATNRLTRIKRAKYSDAVNQRNEARLKQIVIGACKGHKTGNFVVYSKELRPENPKYYRFDYSVRNGVDGVMHYAKEAQAKQFSWKVIAHYPDTRTGFRDAHNKKTLLERATPTILIRTN